MSIVPSEIPITGDEDILGRERKRGWNDCRAQMLRNIEAIAPIAYFSEVTPGVWAQVSAEDRDDSDVFPLYEYPIVPEGWKLVPLEETDEMLEAADTTKDHNVCCMTCASVAYRAMVKAAPAPPESK